MLSGSLPSDFWTFARRTMYLYLVSQSFIICIYIYSMIQGNNRFSGDIPKKSSNDYSRLTELSLVSNFCTMLMMMSFWHSWHLLMASYDDIDDMQRNNNFTGDLPPWLSFFGYLELVDVRNNTGMQVHTISHGLYDNYWTLQGLLPENLAPSYDTTKQRLYFVGTNLTCPDTHNYRYSQEKGSTDNCLTFVAPTRPTYSTDRKHPPTANDNNAAGVTEHSYMLLAISASILLLI